MGDALFELEQNLRSRKEQLSRQEENIFQRCKSQALNHFTAGVIAGGGLVWAGSLEGHIPILMSKYVPDKGTSRKMKGQSNIAYRATWKLNRLLRVNLSGGAAIILGFWRFGNSLDSCVDHILALDGTRMQRELANIIVKKYRHDPWKMQLISKHFYLEEVFDDSTSEPRLRWRYRNFFGDNIDQDQITHNDSPDVSYNATPGDVHNNFDRKRTDLRSEQIPINAVNSGTDLMADPLDCVFGHTATSDEIHHSIPSGMTSRAQSRAHKRSNRRRRLHHQEGSSVSHDR